MSPVWGDVNARARGLATRLLPRERLAALARAPDLAALADALRRQGFSVGEHLSVLPSELDLAVRRMAAAHLRLLARWCGPRAELLAVVFEDEDRRSLRAVLRGAAYGLPAESRLAGAIPTPTLPERALRTLAEQRTVAAVATLLRAWGNPYGLALFPEATAQEPDVFQLELALSRRFAQDVLAAGRRAGKRGVLQRHAQTLIDLENATTALVLAAQGADVVPKDAFLPGGSRLAIAAFEAAIARGGDAARYLAEAFRGTPYHEPVRRFGADPARLEDGLLRATIRTLRDIARREPLSPAPVLSYVLELRALVVDLRRIIWGVALGAGAQALSDELVSA